MNFINSMMKKKIKYEKCANYWRDKYSSLPLAPELSRKTNCITNCKTKRLSYKFATKTCRHLVQILTDNNIELSKLFLTLFAKTLSDYANQSKLTINYTINDKMTVKNCFHLIGDFTNSVLIDFDFTNNNIESVYSQTGNKLRRAIANRFYSGVEVIRDIKRKNGSLSQAIMPIVFTCLYNGKNKLCNNDIGNIEYIISQTSQVSLDFQIIEFEDGLSVSWDVVPEWFDVDIDQLFNAFIEKINYIINENPKNVFSCLESHKNVLDYVKEYNNQYLSFEPKNLVELIQNSCEKYPDKVAIKDKNGQITFSEILKQSEQVAQCLIEKNVQVGSYVGVEASKKISTIVNIIGILKCGAAYVPIDPTCPTERKKYIINRCNISYLLDETFYDNAISKNASFNKNKVFITPETSAYVIFTSGTSGIPKGVEIAHNAVCNTILDINKKMNITCKDKIIGISSLCFDLSVYDVFGALISGAELYLQETATNTDEIISIMQNENITFWNTVPAIMELFIDRVERHGNINFPYVKNVLMSGDWIPLSLPNKIKKFMTNANMYSLGGATEASIWSIYYPIKTVSEKWVSIPYGYPLANQQMYILDYELKSCPINTVGEICIGGTGVAKGYINDTNKTNESFIIHPKYGRIYKTGDFGVMKKGGWIEFLGRKDNQIKINGFRVELGEIEKVIQDCSGSKRVCVKIIQKTLVGYLDTKICEEKELMTNLSKYLPSYMVPKKLIYIEQFPLTSNGKIDLNSLPVSITGENNNLPSTKSEKMLYDIWSKLFNTSDFGIDDDFMVLGGDTLLIQRMANAVENELHCTLSLDIFFENTNIKDLAKAIDESAHKNTVKKAQIVHHENNEKPFKLTDMQMAYYLGRNGFELGNLPEHYYLELETELDITELNKAFNRVIKKHSMLRSIINDTGLQVIKNNVPNYNFDIIDAKSLTKEEINNKIKELRNYLNAEKFNLSQWPLFHVVSMQLSDSTSYLFFSIDLMIADGASQQIIIADLLSMYKSNVLVKPLEFDFNDYVLNTSKNESNFTPEAKAFFQEKS